MTTGNIAAYTNHLKARGLRPATITAYTGWLHRLPDPIDSLTTSDLEDWIAAHDWMPNSHQKAVQAVRYYYQWLHATGRRADDPSATLVPARSPAPVPNPCPEDVYARALDAAQGQDYWRLRLAAETGMRRGELAACHSDDVHQLVGGATLKVIGKGGKRRWIPIPDDLAQWIRLQRGYVFPTRDGGVLTTSGIGRWYRRALGIKVHSLRHRYATICYRATGDIHAVSRLMGHSSTATTEIYLAISDDVLRQCASAAWHHAA